MFPTVTDQFSVNNAFTIELPLHQQHSIQNLLILAVFLTIWLVAFNLQPNRSDLLAGCSHEDPVVNGVR